MKVWNLFVSTALLSWGTMAQTNNQIIDFEDGPLGAGHYHTSSNFENDPIDNGYFNSTYHIQFFSGTYDYTSDVWTQDATLPKYASPGGAQAAFANVSNFSSCASMNTPHDFPHAAPDPGCWFLTDNDGLVQPDPQDLMIDYDESAIKSYSASASLYDLDGSTKPEAWRISLFTIDTLTGLTSYDNSVYLLSVSASSANWTNCVGAPSNSCEAIPGSSIIIDNDNGDGTATEWSISSTSGNPIDFIIIHYIGHGANNLDSPNARRVGVAFDNFHIFGESPCEYTPSFTASQSPINPCITTFTDITTYPSLPGIEKTQVSWDFGDGNTGIEESVYHAYDSPGTYLVCMTTWTIYEGECCKQTVCEEIDIESVCDPCELMENVTITASGTLPTTFSVDGIPASIQNMYAYLWDFGDGTTANGSIVQHSYSSSGSYEACLTLYYFDEETETCCSHTICIRIDQEESGDGRIPNIGEDDRENETGGTSKGMMIPELKISPNPTDGLFRLETTDDIQIQSVKILDSTGKTVYQQDVNFHSPRLTLTSKNLTSGLYFVIVNPDDPDRRLVNKLLIR